MRKTHKHVEILAGNQTPGRKNRGPADFKGQLYLDYTTGEYYKSLSDGPDAEWVLYRPVTSVALDQVKTDLSNKFIPVVPTKSQETAIVFGTSIEAQNGTGVDTLNAPDGSSAVSGRGWFNWMNAFLGQRFTLVRNAGVGGNTYSQMRARINSDVLAYPSDWVIIGAPANDWGQAISAATTIDLLNQMITILQDAGRKVAVITFVPRGDMDTAMRAKADAFRNYVRSIDGRRGLVVLDNFRATADPTTYAPITGSTVAETPAIHYSETGAARVGRVLAEEFSAHIPPIPRGLQRKLDDRSIIGNPTFTGGTGWTTGTGGGVGTTAATYQGGHAFVELAGYTGNNDPSIVYLENISGGRFAVGDNIQASVRLNWAGLIPVGVAAREAPLIRVMQRKADNSFGVRQLDGFVTASAQAVIPNRFPESGEIILKTPKLTIEAGVDRLYVYLGWLGAAKATLDFSELSVTKV